MSVFRGAVFDVVFLGAFFEFEEFQVLLLGVQALPWKQRAQLRPGWQKQKTRKRGNVETKLRV